MVADSLFLLHKLLIINWALLSLIKMKPPYSGSRIKSVFSQMDFFLQKSKLVKL